MPEPTYVSNGRIERQAGPLRIAHLPGEAQPVSFSVHGASGKHYGVDAVAFDVTHATTLDYIVAATGG